MQFALREGMQTPIRILFVEDDAEMSAIYAENFISPEFEVKTASSGVEALKMLEESSGAFDLIVTDNIMPGMDGITLLRKVQNEFPSIKIIMVTGYGDWAEYIAAHNAGVLRFLDKPVRMSDLKKVVLDQVKR